jgi:EAL and modified HD-GYP domain-containing signal transduction protein
VVLAPLDLPLDDSLARWVAPRNVLLEVGQQALADPAGLKLLLEVQRHGVRLVLRVTDRAALVRERLPLFQYIATDAAACQQPAPRESALFALHPQSRSAVAGAFANGAHAVVGWPLAEAAVDATGQLQPQQRAVLELIRLVQSDADGKALERAFKAEPVLSYMLLTLANSPAFVRGTPIASIGQAISLLGYQRLVKWLVLLMVVAAKSSKALPFIYTAVARGFFMENLAAVAGAQGNARDECFVTGAFSLLDKITGRSLAQLFDEVPLPSAIAAALIDASGPYAAHLGLARALETADPETADSLSAELNLPRAEINRALLQALAATDALQSAV